VNGYVKDPTLDFDFLLKEFDHEFDLVDYINTDHSQKLDQNHPPSPSSSTASETERILNIVMPKGLNTVEQKQNSIDIDATLAAPDNSVTTITTSLIEQHSVLSCDQINKEESVQGIKQRLIADCDEIFEKENSTSLQALSYDSRSIEIQDVSGILNSIHPNLLFDFASKSNSASSEDFKCSKDEMLKTRDKKIFRRKQNNKASRESRLRKKEEFQRLLEEKHLKEKRKKDLENEVAHLQGGIKELYASQERTLETAIQENPNVSLPLFLEQLLQLIRQYAIEKKSTGEVYSKTIENVIRIYQRIMERNFGKEEKVMVREWLQSHLVSTNNSF